MRWERIRFASVMSAEIRSSTSCALTGSSSFTSTSTVGSSGLRRGERAQPVEQVLGQDQRAEHLAVLDHLLGLFARVDVDALDPVAKLGSRASLGAELVLAGAEVEALALGRPR